MVGVSSPRRGKKRKEEGKKHFRWSHDEMHSSCTNAIYQHLLVDLYADIVEAHINTIKLSQTPRPITWPGQLG